MIETSYSLWSSRGISATPITFAIGPVERITPIVSSTIRGLSRSDHLRNQPYDPSMIR